MAGRGARSKGSDVSLFDVPLDDADASAPTSTDYADDGIASTHDPSSTASPIGADDAISRPSGKSTRSVNDSLGSSGVAVSPVSSAVSGRRRASSSTPVVAVNRTAVEKGTVAQERRKTSETPSKTASKRPSLVQGDIFELIDEGGMVKGYRGVVASEIAGITYRQLDYWARKRILEPSINPSHGSGSRRLYSFKDILILSVSKKLLDTGVNLQNVTSAITFLSHQSVDALEHMTIIYDGTQVRQCQPGEQVLDLVEQGTAIFAVSVGKMWQEVDKALEGQPCIEVGSGAVSEGPATQPIDDLMTQRMREKIEARRLERARNAEEAGNAGD